MTSQRQHAVIAKAAGLRRSIQVYDAFRSAGVAEDKAEIIKWTVATMFAAVALFASITKLWH